MNMNGLVTQKQGTVQARDLEILPAPNNPCASGSPFAWEEQITKSFVRGRAGNLDLARIVCSAKSALPRGQWTQLWKSGRLPFSKRKGEMLVVIGQRLGSLNAQTFARLPVGWSALYQLARLDLVALENLVREGTVHPALTLKEAKELVAGLTGRIRTATPSRQSNFQKRLQCFQEFVLASFQEWPPLERNRVAAELRQLAEELAQGLHSGQRPDAIVLFPENSEHAISSTLRTAAL